MDIETTARRIKTGEVSQHGSRHAPEQEQVPAHLRLRALLRGESRSSRAEEASYFAETPAGSIFPTPTGAQTGDAASGQTAEDARSTYEGLTVPVLANEVKVRNDGRSGDDVITPESGRKADLIAALVADDERQLASV